MPQPDGEFPPPQPYPQPSSPPGPFIPDNGSGSRTTLLVVGGFAAIVIAVVAVVLWVLLRDRHTGSTTAATSSSSATSTAATSTTITMTISPTATSAHPPTANPQSGGVSVTVDGVVQTINGQVACVSAGGNMNIAVGDSSGGSLAVVLTESDPPEVQTVGIVLGGEPLAYNKGVPGGADAKATKDGNTYTVSGHAMGMPDLSNPTSPPLKAFDIKVTCP